MTVFERVTFGLMGGAVRRLSRLTKRYRRDEEGVAAVEFGLVALPFFALLMAIIEAAMVFFAGQVMETGVRDAARLIRTGQAQAQGMTAATFRQRICQGIPALIQDCNTKLAVDVREANTFAAVTRNCPTTGGTTNPGGGSFSMGAGGSIMIVSACYNFPSFANILGSSLSNQPDGKIQLRAVAAFRNEPFQN